MRAYLPTKQVILLCLVCVQLFARQNAKGTSGRARNEARGETKQVENPPPVDAASPYVIGPEDVLDISVWKEPNVSKTVPVRPDGKISLPLLNDIQAAGLTPIELGQSITTRLGKYITAPQVTVTLVALNSQRVHVMGEVNRPGPILVLPNMTVLQALSAAGGLTQFANRRHIYILRGEGGKQNRYPFNYKAAIRGEMKENITVKSGDTIVVP